MSARLFRSLKGEIAAGKYAKSRVFPSEFALARRFGVSRSLAANVVAELEREGFVFRRQGRGTFVARGAASRRIGLIVPDVATPEFFKPVVSEINRLAREAGYELRFGEVWSASQEERASQMRRLAAEFVEGDFVGVIYEPLAGPSGDEINAHILGLFDRKKLPVVLLDCDIVPMPDRSRYDVVGVNDFAAGGRIAAHLVRAGAKNVHFLMCSHRPTTFLNRLAGAKSALRSAGAEIAAGGSVLNAEPDDLDALKAYLRRHRPRPDAFVCGNDNIAAVFMRTLERAGLRVPGDVMLTGFADLPIASLVTPMLTTVSQNHKHIAQSAFRRLLERVADPSLPPCDIFLPASLVVRESTSGGSGGAERRGGVR